MIRIVVFSLVLALLAVPSYAADWGAEEATLEEYTLTEMVIFGMLVESTDERQLLCHLDFLRDKLEAIHAVTGPISRSLLVATVVDHMKHIGDYDGPGCWPNQSTEEMK